MLTAVHGHEPRSYAVALLLISLLVLSVSAYSSSYGHIPSTVCTAAAQVSAATRVLPAAASAASTASKALTAWQTRPIQTPTRHLLQSSSFETTCNAESGSVIADKSALFQAANTLLGDSRIHITGARFTGHCAALGVALFSAPHTFSAFFPAAVVLSTGDSEQGTGDLQSSAVASLDLRAPGDPSIGTYTHDAAVLELDLSIDPALRSEQQLLFNYLFGSEEYGSPSPNADSIRLSIVERGINASTSTSFAAAVDLSVLPGGSRLQPPSSAEGVTAGVQVFSNTAGRYRTALNGFTKVLPSKGFPVAAGRQYTLRLAIADANHGLVDSVLMFPAGSLRLVPAPTASAGGPYAMAPNSKLTLKGSSSSSPNGAILSYRWTISPALHPADPADPTSRTYSSDRGVAEPVLTVEGALPVVNSPPEGTYSITLEVWDVLGAYGSSSTLLSVDAANVLSWWTSTPGFAVPPPPAAPRPVAVIAVNGSKADTPLLRSPSDAAAMVDLDATASRDSRGSLLVYSWRVIQTEPLEREVDLVLGFVQPPRFVQSMDSGVYIVELNVTGPGGTSSKQVLLTVAANTPPVAMPGGPYVATVGKPIVIDAGGSSDADGDPLTYSWVLSRAGNVIGRYNGSSLSMTLNKPGTFNLQLTVRDNRGGVSTAATELTSWYTVPSPPPAPPSAIARTPAQRVAAWPPQVMTSEAAPAPNARVSAASIPGAVTTAALGSPASYPSTGGLESGYGYGFDPAPATQQQMFSQNQQQQALPSYQQLLQPQSQQQLLPSYQQQEVYPTAPQQQQQQQLLLQPQQYAAGMQQQQYAAGMQQQQYAAGMQQQLHATAALAASQATPYGFQASGTTQQQLAPPAAPAQPLGMCLFTNGQPNYNPLDAAAALQGKLPNSYWGPCLSNPANGFAAPPGILTAPALPAAPPAAPPAPPAVPAANAVASSSGSSATASHDSSAGNIVSAAGASAGEPVKSTAVIHSPREFVKAEGAATQVALDAAGSTAALGRSIVAYQWTVYDKLDNRVVTSVDGQRTPVWLAPGEYNLQLQITDTAGQIASVQRGFALGDVAATQAYISSPPGFIEVKSAESAVEVQLSAAGSQAGPSRSITGYSWSILQMPDNSQVAVATGPAATAFLPGGSYRVQLIVHDSRGGNTTAVKQVAVGGRGSTGVTAVMTRPPPVVQLTSSSLADAAAYVHSSFSTSTPRPAGSSNAFEGTNLGTTTVTLDASASASAHTSSSIREYVWAVLSLPDKRPVCNATGKVTTVSLSPGLYQVGLLVLDTDGGTAATRKNVIVQRHPASNQAPVVPSGLSLSGTSGGSIALPGASDPDGDPVHLSWSLLSQGSGFTTTGTGPEVPLEGLAEGTYLLLMTAADSRGAESSGTAHVTVTASESTVGSRATGTSTAAEVGVAATPGVKRAGSSVIQKKGPLVDAEEQQAIKAAAAASIFSSPPDPTKLPVLLLPQGSVLSMDAAAIGLGSPAVPATSYSWELQQRGTGNRVATVFGRIGRFELPNLDAYNIKLLTTDKEGRSSVSTGSVRVLDSAEGSGLAAALNPAVNPVVSVQGRCGPFHAQQYTAAVLRCPELMLDQLDPADLHWAWRVTQTAQPRPDKRKRSPVSFRQGNNLAVDGTTDSTGTGSNLLATQVQISRDAAFLGLLPGLHRVELAVGARGPPSSLNTAYYLVTYLYISPVHNLTLSLPASAVCAGQPLALEAPELSLKADGPQADFTWQVTCTQPTSSAAAAAGLAPATTSLQGTGRTFGFTLQPGRCQILLQAFMPDGQVLEGSGVVKAKACVGCKQGVVEVAIPQGSCRASRAQAAEVLSGELPDGFTVEWAEGTDLTPGLRNVSVVAGIRGTQEPGAAGNRSTTPSCRAQVRFADLQPPTLTALHVKGLCLAPANAQWSCWHAHQLVGMSDNCASEALLSFKVQCSSGSGLHADNARLADDVSVGSSRCEALPDGRVCVRAMEPGQVTYLSIVAKDHHGNVASPVRVAVSVYDQPPQLRECSKPASGKPLVMKLSHVRRHADSQ